MVFSIDINDMEDEVYQFNDFELCLSTEGHYILSDSGYFEFKTIEDFKQKEDKFFISYEKDIIMINIDDMEKIKDLLIKWNEKIKGDKICLII